MIKQKKVILSDWKCRENSFLKKGRSEEFQDVNNAVWCWFYMAWEALMPVSDPMIQEEVLQIALKLDVTGFTNGWSVGKPDIMLRNFEWLEKMGK